MALTSSPSSLTFTGPALKTTTQTVTVDNTGGSTAAALSLTQTGSDLSLSAASVAVGVKSTITVSYCATSSAAATATLTIVGDSTKTISITLTPTNPLVMSATIDFGTIAAGGSSMAMLSIQNQSDLPAALTLPTSPFSAPANFATVPPGAVVSIQVTYAQSAVATDTQDITLTVGTFSTTCTLSGVCTAAPDSDDDTPDSSDGPTDTVVATSNQSYTVYVPTESTIFNLGRKRESLVKIDGFGFNTTGSAFFYTGDDFGVRVGGDLMMQAEKDMNFVTTGDATLAAHGAAFLFGGIGINIGTVAANTSFEDDSLMPNDEGIKPAKQYLADATVAFATLDTALATFQLALLAKQTYTTVTTGEWEWGLKSSAPKIIGLTAGIAATLVSATNSIAAISGAAATDKGTDIATKIGSGLAPITMYAQGGLLVGTPAFASYYAAAGMVLGSLYPLMFGWDTSVMAANDLALTALGGEANVHGNEAKLSGSEKAEVKSPKLIEITAKTLLGGMGMVEIKPNSIELTACDVTPPVPPVPALVPGAPPPPPPPPPPGAPQSAIEMKSGGVEVTSKALGAPALGGTGTIDLKPTELKLSVAGTLGLDEGEIEIKPTEMTLSVQAAGGAQTGSVEIKPTAITLDAGLTGTLTLKAGGWSMVMSSTGISMKNTTGTCDLELAVAQLSAKVGMPSSASLTLAAGGIVTLQGGPATSLKVSPAGLEHKGMLHDLG